MIQKKKLSTVLSSSTNIELIRKGIGTVDVNRDGLMPSRRADFSIPYDSRYCWIIKPPYRYEQAQFRFYIYDGGGSMVGFITLSSPNNNSCITSFSTSGVSRCKFYVDDNDGALYITTGKDNGSLYLTGIGCNNNKGWYPNKVPIESVDFQSLSKIKVVTVTG